MKIKAMKMAVVLSCCAAAVWAEPVKEGSPAPVLSNYTLAGKVPETKGRVVILDFWASWCGPCAGAMPALDALYQKYKDQGLIVLGVSVDDDATKMEAFLAKHPVSFPTVRDVKQALVEVCAIESMPTSIVIGRDGKVAAVHRGYHGAKTEEAWDNEIRALIKGAQK